MKRRKRTRGAREAESGRFGFDNWDLEAREKFDGLLDAMIAEGLQIATEQYECVVYLDGGDLVIELPLGPTDSEGPTWRYALATIVSDAIELNELEDGGPIDDEGREYLGRIKTMFAALTSQIDEALHR